MVYYVVRWLNLVSGRNEAGLLYFISVIVSAPVYFVCLDLSVCLLTTTDDRYPLKSFGPGRLLATFPCLLLPSLRPLMFESVSPLIVSLSLVDMLCVSVYYLLLLLSGRISI